MPPPRIQRRYISPAQPSTTFASLRTADESHFYLSSDEDKDLPHHPDFLDPTLSDFVHLDALEDKSITFSPSVDGGDGGGRSSGMEVLQRSGWRPRRGPLNARAALEGRVRSGARREKRGRRWWRHQRINVGRFAEGYG